MYAPVIHDSTKRIRDARAIDRLADHEALVHQTGTGAIAAALMDDVSCTRAQKPIGR